MFTLNPESLSSEISTSGVRGCFEGINNRKWFERQQNGLPSRCGKVDGGIR